MKISARLKERFCKDCNIPIRIFEEPYFTDRLKLYDKYYRTLEKWYIFVEELEKYHCEQDYLEEYNRVKDAAIESIKNTEAYKRFNEEDMNKYQITHKDLPNSDIFKSTNDGKTFISIDMRKANFSSLHYYDDFMFNYMSTWEEFIGLFTNNKHIINSKYIRQVILGNCNPKRHIAYEKYIMDKVLDFVEKSIPIDKVVFFSNDEIIFDITDTNLEVADAIILQQMIDVKFSVPLKVELFVLHKIHGTDGYYKEIFHAKGICKKEFKCLDNYMLPFVMRYFNGEEVTDSDKVFYHEGLLAQFIEVPNIEIKNKEAGEN